MSRRTAAVFKESSRLYRQAGDGGKKILADLKDRPDFMLEAMQYLKSNRVSLALHEYSDYVRAINVSLQYLSGVASTVDPRFAIPVLMSAMDRYYYGEKQEYEVLPAAGPALKVAIALVAKNRRSVSACGRSHAQLVKLVNAAAAFQNLQQNADLARGFGFGPAEINIDGVKLSPSDWAIAAAWNEYAKPRGEIQRTVKESIETIWNNIDEFISVAKEVIGGADPARIPLLKDTLFSYVRVRAFWLGILLRLVLFLAAQKIKSSVDDGITGISLFEEFGFQIPGLNAPPNEVQNTIHELFWRDDWYAKRHTHSLSSMIVERPAIRLDGRTFVTTPLIVADSLNNFIEQSVMGYTPGGVDIKCDDVFRRAISVPFETDVIAMFKSAGWAAGSVSMEGVWSVGNEVLVRPDAPCPGEIDVLARSPCGNLYLLGECKVLSDPMTASTLRNVVSKLGADDSEGFHSKLDKKAKWLHSLARFSQALIEPVLIVDRGAFFAKTPPHPVFDADDLAECLPKLVAAVGEE